MDILLKTVPACQGTGQAYTTHGGTQWAGGTHPTDTRK